MALMPFKNVITLIQMDGLLTHEEFIQSVELAKRGCMEVYAKQREALEEHFKTVSKEEA